MMISNNDRNTIVIVANVYTELLNDTICYQVKHMQNR